MRRDDFESKIDFVMLIKDRHRHVLRVSGVNILISDYRGGWCRVSGGLRGKFFLDEETGSSTYASLRYSVGACSSGGGGTACRVAGRILGVDAVFRCGHLCEAKSGCEGRKQ